MVERAQRALAFLPPGAARPLEAALTRIGPVRRALERQYDEVVESLAPHVHPYRAERPPHTALPERPVERERLLAELRARAAREQPRWADGLVSGAVYHGDAAHLAFLHEAYALHSQTNPLHADVFPVRPRSAPS